MDPLTALGLASNVIQIVDFTSRLLSNSKEIYDSADGTLEMHRSLRQAATNLQELSAELRPKRPSNLQEPERYRKEKSKPASEKKEIRPADVQLLELTIEAKRIADKVSFVVESLTSSKTDRKYWRSIQQALRAAWTQKEFLELEARLDTIRKEIDTALLMSLRERLDRMSTSYTAIEAFGANVEKRHQEVLSAISASNAPAPHRTDFAHFSSGVQSMAEEDFNSRFARIILAELRFPDMPDRFESIPEAHQTTFNWLFNQTEQNTHRTWDSFPEWLGSSDSSHLYWITGKPGSGKSTLMKYLFENQRTYDNLKIWADSKPLIRAGFFFWSSGTAMQMSRIGLLSTLLLESIQQLLKQDSEPDILQKLFPERWEQYIHFGGGREPFKWIELQRTFNLMLSDNEKRFYIVIDGLDEFDGKPRDLVDFIIAASKRSNVKVCTSSRPWVVFEDAFESDPSLLLEHLTRQDIVNYVTAKFRANRRFARLEQHDPVHTQTLIRNVVEKAAGVFLWVYLVVESLLEGISNADRMADLQMRLDALPADLEALFDNLLRRLDPMYFQRACQLFRLIRTHLSTAPSFPTALQLSFADDDDIRSGMHAKIEMLADQDLMRRVDDMKRRLKSNCKGFLEVEHHGTVSDNVRELGQFSKMKIRYLHRTARDFLHSESNWKVIMEATADPSFDPEERWANAFLWAFKISVSPHTNNSDDVIDSFTWCVEYALRLETRDGKVRLTYLDEVGRAAMSKHVRIVLGNFHCDQVADISKLAPFFELALDLGLQGYVRIKAQSTQKSVIKKAIGNLVLIRTASSGLEGRTALHNAITVSLDERRDWCGTQSRLKSMLHRLPKPIVPDSI